MLTRHAINMILPNEILNTIRFVRKCTLKWFSSRGFERKTTLLIFYLEAKLKIKFSFSFLPLRTIIKKRRR
jgi:hypothetical protein